MKQYVGSFFSFSNKYKLLAKFQDIFVEEAIVSK